ncbi:MbcA/ParS/Xre antitoxin family protein [Rhodohalobacter sp. 8-1]|uniref:MbcA/ParS/Xre antitoxin family protein n=1 Tax=Rhodohalobacter sp. 8-1 TaxID=3131972 RepID=UPI0030EDE3EB
MIAEKKETSSPPDESEHGYRIARLTDPDHAYQVFEDADKVARWFSQPNHSLGNKKPLDLAKTEPDARLVEQLLGRIKHGITV